MEAAVRGGHSAPTMPSILSCVSLLVLLALAFCCVSGCAQLTEDRGTGITFTTDGRMVENSATNRQLSAQRQIEKAVDAALGANWSCRATITPLPVWREFMVKGDGDWYWEVAEVQVALSHPGAGHETPPVAIEEIRSGVIAYMTGLMAKGKKDAVTVFVHHVELVPPGVVPEVATPIPDPRPAVTPASSRTLQQGERTYRIQAGDTLADITTLFYGAPTEWRRLVAANPGLDPAQLAVGTEIVIPPRPALIMEPVAP